MFPPPGYQSGRNTPMSMAPGVLHQPVPSRPVTNYLDVQIPGTRSPNEGDLPPGGPTDAELDQAVEMILREADLNTITKREIRRQLEDYFHMDLSSRKHAIGVAIDRVLVTRAT